VRLLTGELPGSWPYPGLSGSGPLNRGPLAVATRWRLLGRRSRNGSWRQTLGPGDGPPRSRRGIWRPGRARLWRDVTARSPAACSTTTGPAAVVPADQAAARIRGPRLPYRARLPADLVYAALKVWYFCPPFANRAFSCWFVSEECGEGFSMGRASIVVSRPKTLIWRMPFREIPTSCRSASGSYPFDTEAQGRCGSDIRAPV